MTHVPANVDRFSGFADTYDAYRPTPPLVIVDILTQLAGTSQPARVVDIGCGTGLSTRIWAGRANEIIGIEPNSDMRHEAERRTRSLPGMADISYREGFSHKTGLPDGWADVVTCSECLHWMEPESTFAEISRILRRGGVFAAYDCDWPPTIDWQIDSVFGDFLAHVWKKEEELGVYETVKNWSKREHLSRIQASGHFRYTKEITAHGAESGDAERLVGLARSFGVVAELLRRGLSEEEIGLRDLQGKARHILRDAPRPWYFSYRIRLGIK